MTSSVARSSRHHWMLSGIGVLGLAAFLVFPSAVNADQVIIVQTNAAGDNVHLIDPITNTIVGEITGVEVIHGVAAAPDGSRLYLSNESTETLDIVDTKTLEVTKQIPLSGRPNNVAIHENGERLYVAIQGTGWWCQCRRHRRRGAGSLYPDPSRCTQHVHHARQQAGRGGLHRGADGPR